jgi:hypothetical protein
VDPSLVEDLESALAQPIHTEDWKANVEVNALRGPAKQLLSLMVVAHARLAL